MPGITLLILQNYSMLETGILPEASLANTLLSLCGYILWVRNICFT